MGREEIAALIRILETQRTLGTTGIALGTWKISFDKKRGGFYFDKCESEAYCEERPAFVALDGRVIDPGGPLFD